MLKNDDDLTSLFDYFGKDKTIKEMKLLYRESEHNFEAKAFHDLCDEKAHTILLVKTNFDKIIGGYTSIEWQSGKKFAKQSSNSSFLFSITNNHKL